MASLGRKQPKNNEARRISQLITGPAAQRPWDMYNTTACALVSGHWSSREQFFSLMSASYANQSDSQPFSSKGWPEPEENIRMGMRTRDMQQVIESQVKAG